MNKKIECEIMPHENGWAVLVGSVMQAVYPSRYLAVTSMKAENVDFVLTDEAAASRGTGSAFRLTVAVPYQVDIPLKYRNGEINTPVSLEGRDLATGKL